ncbi:MAG: MerR family transcriptional regulator [Meiothermus sp.]
MPLNRIAEVLELPGTEAAQAISRYWGEVEGDVKTKRKLVQYLEDYRVGKGESMYKVETREVPEQKVATVQQGVYVKDLPGFIQEATRELLKGLSEAGLSGSGPMFEIYHGEVNEDSAGPVEVCVPFAGSLEPVERVRVRLEPAHAEAFTRITKAQVEFPGILGAYDAVSKWLGQHDRCMSDSPREVYFAE